MNSPFGFKRRKIIRQFGDKLGFLYFGTVDQHNDDHKIVRGFSVSPTHRDTNYMVGNYDGFDVMFVDRIDKKDRWFICDIDLKSDDVPHLFLVPTHQHATHYEKVFRSLRTLQKIEQEESEFSRRYNVYYTPEHHSEMEEILTSHITRTIAAHFWPLAIEVWDGSLYIYSAGEALNEHHLETIIKNGAWLAQALTSRENE